MALADFSAQKPFFRQLCVHFRVKGQKIGHFTANLISKRARPTLVGNDSILRKV
jgi:hypothetical protein